MLTYITKSIFTVVLASVKAMVTMYKPILAQTNENPLVTSTPCNEFAMVNVRV